VRRRLIRSRIRYRCLYLNRRNRCANQCVIRGMRVHTAFACGIGRC
jgi:hypothetical protein